MKRNPEQDLKVCEQATDGPWEYSKHDCSIFDGKGDDIVQLNEDYCPYFHREDAEFITLARTALPDYIQRCVEMEAIIAEVNHYLSQEICLPHRCAFNACTPVCRHYAMRKVIREAILTAKNRTATAEPRR